mgnify:CR=1 FL=1|tara:strand:- start:657 stop:824 length:168 start_codon:yes stop_codon:yes gene_type:complete
MKEMKKTKPELLTTLKVGKETHKRVKQYCDKNNLWICRFVENVLNEYLEREGNNG